MQRLKWILTERQICDLEMLSNGGYAPLTDFMDQQDYENVLQNNSLLNQTLWPIPITFDVNSAFAEKISLNEPIELCDYDHTTLAYMTVSSKWKPDKITEAIAVYGTTNLIHSGVNHLLNGTQDWYLGGAIQLLQLPRHYDFNSLRQSPTALKDHFKKMGIHSIIGFQTRNPIHRAHYELTVRAIREYQSHVLLHPVVGMTKPGDVDHYTRVRCYQHVLKYYPQRSVTLSLLPLAMRMAGPREALWHAIIRKNYGCTHFIIGRDHAGPGCDENGKSFYEPYAAQDFVKQYENKLDIKIICYPEMVYGQAQKKYLFMNELKVDEAQLSISGTQLRKSLSTDDTVPAWFSFPEIIQELRKSYLPKHKQGLTIFFTGLPAAGKSTLAQALMSKLLSIGKMNITFLDGDVMRRMLGAELGFSKADRNCNIARIGFVAAEVTKVGGIAICAAIAPFKSAREENRKLISQFGNYIEIYVSTSLDECEKRDPKGIYKKARRGELIGMTGIDDPYEIPENPDLIIDTSQQPLDESITKILAFLQNTKCIKITDETGSVYTDESATVYTGEIASVHTDESAPVHDVVI